MRRRAKSAKTSSLMFLLKLLVLGCLTASSFMWGASKVRGKDLGKNGIILAALSLLGIFFTFMAHYLFMFEFKGRGCKICI